MHTMLVLVLKLQFEKNSKFDFVFSKSAVFYGTFSNMNNFVCQNKTLYKADEIVSKSKILLKCAVSNTARKA